MARKTGHTGILQAEPHLISYVRADLTGGKPRILAFFQERGHWPQEDGELARALTAFANNHGLAEDTIYTVLPRHEITCRIVSLPSHQEAELANMLELSAEEYVPFAASELIIDHAILRKYPSGESDVLAAFAHKDVADNHLRLLRDAGLDPAEIYLSTACLASAAIAGLSQPPERYAVVDLGPSGFEVIILLEDRLQYTRGVAGVHDWEAASQGPGGALEELAIELRSSFSAYRRESPDGVGVEHVFLSSSFADVGPLCDIVSHETAKECQPAKFAQALVEEGAEKTQFLPLVLLGALLNAKASAAVNIELLPAQIERDRALLDVQQKLKRAAGVAAIILAMLGALYFQAVLQRERLIGQLERERDAIAPLAAGVAEKQDQLRILRQQVDHKGTVLELLASIAQAAPEEDLNISRFSYNREEGIDLWGRAKTIDDVHRFAQNIRGLAVGHLTLLSGAVRVYENAGAERGEPIFDYQVSIPFPQDDDSDSKTTE
ncbi:MAG: pilus assembly protein PilM [Candidatus Hydrogenedentes bacterium]|nr:pilus assembly protein PilM [Candidatus Hydrogenedentota bacterium]